MTAKPLESQARIEGLDLLRGLAIGLVLVRHAWPYKFGGGGIVGVVVFFALSGFLITGILHTDLERHGHVRYRRFYRNRIVRLIPALLLMLGAFTLVTLTADPLHERATLVRDLAVALTYIADLPYVHGSSALGHLWTLAVEEQFYLIWPIVLAIGIQRRSLRGVMLVSAVLMVAACLASMAIASPHIWKIYTLPSSWAITLLIGAAAYLERESLSRLLPQRGFARFALSLAALGALLTLTIIPGPKDSPFAYFVMGPGVAVLTVILIFHMRDWQRIPTPWLRPLLALGTISYAAYLWNYPLVRWISRLPSYPLKSVSTVLLTIAAATLSWWLIEKPIATWNRRRHAAARTDIAFTAQ